LTGLPETNRQQLNRLTRYLVNSFTFVPDATEALVIIDGVVTPCYTLPEFKEGLKYANSLYAEGLIDPTTFTNTSDELRQMVEDPSGNRVGVAGALWFGGLGSLEGVRHTEFDILLPVTGPEGIAYSTYEPYCQINGQYIITDKCKYPDVAMKWADYLFSDDAAVRYIECGREGIEWRVPEATELDFYGRPARRARIDDIGYDENTNVHYYQMGPSFRSFEYRESWWRGAGTMYDKDAYEYRLHIYTEPMAKYRPNMTNLRVYPPTYATESDANELKRILPNILDHRSLYVDSFITGQRNIDTEWDAYVAGFESLEIDRYLEIKQRAYDISDYMNSTPDPGNPDAPISFNELFNK
jgi:putative aldouronate transport system substrate-binding protein